MEQTATLAREFEHESYRIDQLIWDAMALRAGESALFCGFANNVEWIKRAVAIGVEVSVVANNGLRAPQVDGLRLTVVRGSTSMIPARDNSYDASIAFHYLHEVDPFFHATVVSELGRVGKRCVIVEPAPPSDPIGIRIASLYARAKRELGQFENYHHIDYWRKLLAIVKSDVAHQTFQFMRRPPRAAIRDTVALIIDMMAAEAAPEPYLAELRELAKRPDAQLVPQARYVIVGTATGEPLNTSAGTNYRDRLPEERPLTVNAIPFVPPRVTPTGAPPAPAVPPAAAPGFSRVYSHPDNEPEFPAIEPPVPAPGRPAPTAAQIARNAFGLTAGESAPRPGPAAKPVVPSVSDSFGPPDDAADAAAEFGWEWEAPEDAS